MKLTGNGKIRFITSAVVPEQYPVNPDALPEIGVIGRSNAGKSSLINAMFGTRIAKVSGTPGKTTLLNFFEVRKGYYLVDMPGYGFAARSRKEVDSWKSMIETYISLRGNLKGLLLIMDCRRNWTEEEAMLVEWIYSSNTDVILVLTKEDKLGKNKAMNAKFKIQKASGIEKTFTVSSSKKKGVVELEEFMYNAWVEQK
ncbi:MAG: ribosome biogenesis GTP-binding protein YihA/YsxC [Bdellovibrionales bacterium]